MKKWQMDLLDGMVRSLRSSNDLIVDGEMQAKLHKNEITFKQDFLRRMLILENKRYRLVVLPRQEAEYTVESLLGAEITSYFLSPIYDILNRVNYDIPSWFDDGIKIIFATRAKDTRVMISGLWWDLTPGE